VSGGLAGLESGSVRLFRKDEGKTLIKCYVYGSMQKTSRCLLMHAMHHLLPTRRQSVPGVFLVNVLDLCKASAQK
jgi:hypothetical protein